jgi:hypothetical protein
MEMKMMKEIQATTNSPLGARSTFFQVKRSENGNILDQPKKGLLELYPAGYTKLGKKGRSRQHALKNIFEAAVVLKTEDQLYPFGKEGHIISLEEEPTNSFDPNAIRIILTAERDHSLFPWSGWDLGYVPMKITSLLKPNLAMINGGRILKVRQNVHGKYWQCKVVFGYSDIAFTNLPSRSAARFAAIMGDL